MSTGRAVALIDYQDHDRRGHFGPWLKGFAREFSRRWDRVLVFTPNPDSTAGLLQLTGNDPAGKVTCHELPAGPRSAFYRLQRNRCPLAKILHAAQKLAPGFDLGGFVMWGDDLLVDDAAAGRSGAPWGTVGGYSQAGRGRENDLARRERELVALCETHPDCTTLLVPDPYALPAAAKALWMPVCENAEAPDSWVADEIAPVRALRRHSGGRFCIGAFGRLTGPRGVNEMLRLAPAHPEIRFALVGDLAVESIEENLQPLLAEKRPDNLIVLPGFLPGDLELNAVMNSVDAVLLDGTDNPAPSGIVTRALAFGKFILTPEADSWTRDVVRAYGAGHVYAERGEDFTAVWQAWRAQGGEAWSQAAATALMGAPAIAACFDALTERLAAR